MAQPAKVVIMLMQRLYNWFTNNPFTVDCVMAALICLPSLAAGASADGLPGVLIAAGLTIPLAWRRTNTVPAAAVVAGTALLQLALGIAPNLGDVSVLFMVYALAAYAPRWASLSGLGLALSAALILPIRYPAANALGESVYVPESSPGGAASGNYEYTLSTLLFRFVVIVVIVWLLVLLSWTLGDLTRSRRLRIQAIADRARRLEVEQQQERALAASDERTHIAREMHDIVAHSLSVIITQADGARYAAANNPEIATQTLSTIADTGRTSLQEMRRLLGVLRGSEDTMTRPQPGLSDLGALTADFQAAGLAVDFQHSSQPRRALPPGAELTIYRVIQEGLSNALKHAGPQTTVTVTLDWDAHGAQIRIDDDGRGAAADLSGSGGGYGLKGMTERVTLYDGTVYAGPKDGGGFAIAATIPYTDK